MENIGIILSVNKSKGKSTILTHDGLIEVNFQRTYYYDLVLFVDSLIKFQLTSNKSQFELLGFQNVKTLNEIINYIEIWDWDKNFIHLKGISENLNFTEYCICQVAINSSSDDIYMFFTEVFSRLNASNEILKMFDLTNKTIFAITHKLTGRISEKFNDKFSGKKMRPIWDNSSNDFLTAEIFKYYIKNCNEDTLIEVWKNNNWFPKAYIGSLSFYTSDLINCIDVDFFIKNIDKIRFENTASKLLKHKSSFDIFKHYIDYKFQEFSLFDEHSLNFVFNIISAIKNKLFIKIVNSNFLPELKLYVETVLKERSRDEMAKYPGETIGINLFSKIYLYTKDVEFHLIIAKYNLNNISYIYDPLFIETLRRSSDLKNSNVKLDYYNFALHRFVQLFINHISHNDKLNYNPIFSYISNWFDDENGEIVNIFRNKILLIDKSKRSRILKELNLSCEQLGI